MQEGGFSYPPFLGFVVGRVDSADREGAKLIGMRVCWGLRINEFLAQRVGKPALLFARAVVRIPVSLPSAYSSIMSEKAVVESMFSCSAVLRSAIVSRIPRLRLAQWGSADRHSIEGKRDERHDRHRTGYDCQFGCHG